MEKTIIVGDKEVRLKTNAGLIRRYREAFGRNLTTDMILVEDNLVSHSKRIEEMLKKQLKEQGYKEGTKEYEAAKESGAVVLFSDLPPEVLDIFERLAYMMHKYADPSQPDDIDEWLEQFELFDIYEIFPEILSIWRKDESTTTESKKKSEKQ